MKNSTTMITVRVSQSEKEYFDLAAKSAGMSLSSFIRYELRNHFMEVERTAALDQLKKITADRELENRTDKRINLLRDILRNIEHMSSWLKAKIKHYQRQLNRMESTRKSAGELEQKILQDFSNED